MGRAETLTAVREKYPQYADMTDDALGTALAQKFPQYRDLAPAAKADGRSVLGGAVMDTLGLTDRPGAVSMTSNKPEGDQNVLGGGKTPLGVILHPSNKAETAASLAVQIPATYAGGALGLAGRALGLGGKVASALPTAGRVAMTGALAKARGESNEQGVLDMVVALASEGLLSGVGHAAGGVGAAAKSMDTIKGWIGKGADKATNLKLLDAVTKRAREAATPAELMQVIQNGRQQLNALYEGAGNAWVRHVVNAKLPHLPAWLSPKVPLGAAKAAQGAEAVTGSPITRAAADTAVGRKEVSPLAAVGALSLAPKVPGVGRALEAVEEATE